MSLFIDVVEPLSSKIKASILDVIAKERNDQDKPIRKICDVCTKYLDYGELRYDRMEDGINRIEDTGDPGSGLYAMLLAILNESLDEDLNAVNYFTLFCGSSLARSFIPELEDFITIGRLLTLKEYDKLETAGEIIIDRYTTGQTVTETISNLYLKIDNEEYIPVFQKLLARATALYPTGISLESLKGFIDIKGKDYKQALESFLSIKDRLEQDHDNKYYNLNLASAWDNIAGCYLKTGDAAKAVESCDIALDYDKKSEDITVGYPILYKKAEACLLLGDKERAIAIADQILTENPEDERAVEIKSRLAEIK